MVKRLFMSSWKWFVVGIFFVLLVLAFAVSRFLSASQQSPPNVRARSSQPQGSTGLPNLVGAVSTQVAVLSYVAPPTPTPWPTPIQDLSKLVSQAQAIVQARIIGTNGAMHSNMYSFVVENWFKKPANVVTNTGILWIPDPWVHIPDYGFRSMEGQADRGDHFVLFMTVNTKGTLEGVPDYFLVGSTTGYFDPGFFKIANERIAWGGIAIYDRWPAAAFKNEISKLQNHQ